MKRKIKDKVAARRRKPRAMPPRVKPTRKAPKASEKALDSVGSKPAEGEAEAMGGSPCTYYPPCSRENCKAPACSHEVAEPHASPATSCEAYLFPEGMNASNFEGGGGGFGGGGASGGW
jgi:uncharacterized membrane protein YgcG